MQMSTILNSLILNTQHLLKLLHHEHLVHLFIFFTNKYKEQRVVLSELYIVNTYHYYV